MWKWISPIGKASDVNLTDAKRAGFKIQFRPSKEDLEKIAAIASELPKNMRKKIVRKGLRNWGEAVKRTMKALAHPKAKRTKRDIAVKTKTYRKGRIWAGVGVRKDGNRVGWRSHMYDQGWRPVLKGLTLTSDGQLGIKPPPKLVRKWKGNRNARIVPFSQNRGWRLGIRKQSSSLGARIYRRLFVTRAGLKHKDSTVQYIYDAVQESLTELKRA
jgi:hypothetical protein